MNSRKSAVSSSVTIVGAGFLAALLAFFPSCGRVGAKGDSQAAGDAEAAESRHKVVIVAVSKVVRADLSQSSAHRRGIPAVSGNRRPRQGGRISSNTSMSTSETG